MFSELANVMDYAMEDNNYLDSLSQNVINKKTRSGIKKTTEYLTALYGFDLNYPPFKALKYFWQISEENRSNGYTLTDTNYSAIRWISRYLSTASNT